MGKLNGFIKKVAYSIGANLISLIVSLLTTFIVPKFLGEDISQYGYLQIYLFYVSYIGFFHLGWCDGIYLRDGGKKYSDLDRPLYSGQFWLLTALQLILSSVVVVIGAVTSKNSNYAFIWMAFAGNMLIFLPRTMLSYYLQTTNRIKEYASLTTVGRIIYGISIIFIVLFFSQDYRYFIYGDLFGKLVALLVSIWWCRDIVFSKPAPLLCTLKETKLNISVGIKLLFANIASMLITGIVRWGIQTKWNVEIYGKISFTLNVSSLLLIFISAVALVLYPTLKRIEENTLKATYAILRDALSIPLLGCLIVYYPIELLLSAWLPQYADSMRYMAILFPMCVFAAKMTMLVQTYMNVFRLEKQMLKVNLVGVLVAIVTTIISVFIFGSLTLSMISIVINQIFRCVYAEYVLSRKMNVHVMKDTVCEIMLSMLFIIANWFVGGWMGVGIYTAGYAIYLLIKRKNICVLVKQLKIIREIF